MLSKRLRINLLVQPDEVGIAGRLTALLFFATFGAAIGSPGVEALFFSRFGVSYLPQMYMILGVLIALTSLMISALLERVDLSRLYVGLPLLMSALLAVSRLLITLDLRWFYALLWLGMNLSWTLIGLFCWGLAGLVCDTRQAKRLYPLISAGGILGLTIGGLITRPLVGWIGTENLLWIWAGSLALAWAIARDLVRHRPASRERRTEAPKPLIEGVLQGARFAFSSPLLRWMALAAVFFAVLYYSVVFPFSSGASASFPEEDALSAFLGQFQGISTLAAFLVSLLLANWIYARFGLMTAILAYTLIYLVGFGTLSIAPAAFPALVAFRFLQLVWSEGVSEGANQAMYNLAPPELREQTRLFIRGVANPAGVSLVGLLLLTAQYLPPSAMYFTGFLAAAITVFLVWKARGAYLAALTDALRIGRHLFLLEPDPTQQSFTPLRMGQSGGLNYNLSSNPGWNDPHALKTLERGLADKDPQVRRVSAEILRRSNLPLSNQAALRGVSDPDPLVRAAMVGVIARLPGGASTLAVLDALADPQPEVRLEALDALVRHADPPFGLVNRLHPLLSDPEPAVRLHAAANLLRLDASDADIAGDLSHNGRLALENTSDPIVSVLPSGEENHQNREYARQAEAVFRELAIDPQPAVRVETLQLLAGLKGQMAFEIASGLLHDEQPAVRANAARVLQEIDPQLCIFPLVAALADENPKVVEAAADALGKAGEIALQPLIASLNSSRSETGALRALKNFPIDSIRSPIQAYAVRKKELALKYQDFWYEASLFVEQSGLTPVDDRRLLLADALQIKARQQGELALRAAALLSGGGSMERSSFELAIERLSSPELDQRSNAIEALESVSQRDLVRPMIQIWEGSVRPQLSSSDWLAELLDDPDPWIKACAVLVAASEGPGEIAESPYHAELIRMAESDPDPLVRETAGQARSKVLFSEGGLDMETLPTLGSMERILFLRKVPIFAELPPAELLQIAEISTEQFCLDGTQIARQGEVGERIYMIVSGEVRIVTRSEMGEMEVARARPSDFVGEMSVISQAPHSASLIASGETRLLTISRLDFEQILRLRPETSLAVMRVLCSRLRGMIAHDLKHHTSQA